MDIPPSVQRLTATCAIGFGCLMTLALIFFPKFSVLFVGHDMDANFKLKLRSPLPVITSPNPSGKQVVVTGKPLPAGGDTAAGIMKSLPSVSRQQYIMNQIYQWQVMLMDEVQVAGGGASSQAIERVISAASIAVESRRSSIDQNPPTGTTISDNFSSKPALSVGKTRLKIIPADKSSRGDEE